MEAGFYSCTFAQRLTERANLDIVRLILNAQDKPESLIAPVQNRPRHDRRYAIDNRKITSELGWKPEYTSRATHSNTMKYYYCWR